MGKILVTILLSIAVIIVGIFIYSNRATAPNDLIFIDNPKPNDEISSPLNFSGRARGYWFFEASAPVRVYDANGLELGVGLATVEGGEWMTENFVPFLGSVIFSQPKTATGKVVFEKDNPSGLPEHDRKVEIPVRFK